MEIILSTHCRSFTGYISKSHGYYIRHIGNRFISQRSSKGYVPPDGHIRFIFACADMAQYNYFIADIDVEGEELLQAAREAHVELDSVVAEVHYNAEQVRDIKHYYGL